MTTATVRRNGIALFPLSVLAVASLAVYANTLAGEFVYDDMSQVLENRWIRDVSYLPDILFKSVWSFLGEGTSNYYRPMMHTVYMANYHLFGLKPWGFHLVNALFHAGTSLLVFLLAARLFPPRYAAPSAGRGMTGEVLSIPFIAALLFAVHPIHTEAVAWVAGLPDLSFSFFFLLSFLLYIVSTSGDRLHKGFYSLSVASFFLSALSKEPALTLPLLLFAYDHLFGDPGTGFKWRWKRYVPYLLAAAVYFALRLYALGGIAPEKRHEHLSALQHVINVFPLFMDYLGKLLLPIRLNAFHVFRPVASLLEARGILSIAVFAAFAAATVLAYRRNRAACFCLLLIVIPLLPAFYIRGLGLNTFAERYLYLPSAGFAMLAAMPFARAAEGYARRAVAAIAALALLAGIYSVGTVRRNAVWRENLTLFADTVRKSPDAGLPQKELGIALLEKGKVEEAIASFEKAILIEPSDFRVYNNRGMAFDQMGRFDLAMADFDRAIALEPRACEAYNNKGKSYGQIGRFEEAIEQFHRAIEINPAFAMAHCNRGLAYSLIGRDDMARKDVNRAIELDKHYAEAYGARGNLHRKAGRRDLAVSDFRKACELGEEEGCRALRALLQRAP
jgi:Flp pilus assembly protein TadD